MWVVGRRGCGSYEIFRSTKWGGFRVSSRPKGVGARRVAHVRPTCVVLAGVLSGEMSSARCEVIEA